jgi:hypothetical protein
MASYLKSTRIFFQNFATGQQLASLLKASPLKEDRLRIGKAASKVSPKLG